MSKNPNTTPMIRQYYAIKEEVPEMLLFFRLGDFYELFFEDAVIAAKELQITLTARHKEKGGGIPMCGVPYHAAEGYIARLIKAGHKVAVCDQTEKPKKGVKLVARKITKVITPGTITDPNILSPNENNYLLAIVEKDNALGIAFLDVSTGEFRVRSSDANAGFDRLLLDIEHLRPSELVFPRSSRDKLPLIDNCVLTPLDDWLFEAEAERLLCQHFGVATLDGFGLNGKPAAVGAAGSLLYYARHTQKADLPHINSLNVEEEANYMVIDPSSVRNLELLEPSSNTSKAETLLGVVNHTVTPMGGRLLRAWLIRPLLSLSAINARQDAIEELNKSLSTQEGLRDTLNGICDLERILSKVTVGSASPRDLLSLRDSCQRLPALKSLTGALKTERFKELHETLDLLENVETLLNRAITDDPPINLAAGSVIRGGYNENLDHLRSLSMDSKTHLAALEQRERKRTGINSLKLRFNKVFGYYIEVSKSNLELVPDDYRRKQTLVGHERFVTDELKQYEDSILSAEEQLVSLEKKLFEDIRTQIAGEASRIKSVAMIISQLDVLTSLSLHAMRFSYCKPTLSKEDSILIRNGRHPVLEVLAEEQRADRFIPNDLFMDEGDNRIQIITGPNMGGKSTFLRQNALIAILAQMGSFVPADFARLPIIDRVFTRIGASDNLSRGRSTFMVEMTEAAIILNSATAQSLIVLDEIGRGTATFDGLSIAWAVIEHIRSDIGAKTLFATHYHELTELENILPGIRNLHLTVKEAGERIIFLRKLADGPASRSYGIEVARLAGLPASVIERARTILKGHEETGSEISDNLTTQVSRKERITINQLALFSPEEERLRGRLEDLELDHLTPLEALKILAELKKSIEK